MPLAWAVLLLFHPTGEGETINYAELADDVTPWMVVHLGMLFFIPLIAVVIYLLLRGIDGTAARVARIALVPFVLFYGAFETLVGLGTGILVHEVNARRAPRRRRAPSWSRSSTRTSSSARSASLAPSAAWRSSRR